MDYEKKYKEALERARKLAYHYDSNGVKCTNADIESIFPELKESEDEKIRNGLVRLLKELLELGGVSENEWNRNECEKYIAWLEKQCEKMSDPRYSILDKLIEADDIYQMSVNDAMVEEAKNKAIVALSELEVSKLLGLEKQGEQKPVIVPKFKVGDIIKDTEDGEVFTIRTITKDKYIYTDDSFDWIKDQDIYELVEKKPMDKVEPKFKVGDWIVSGNNNVAYIESISETKYNLQCKDGYHEKMSIEYIDRCWHLWTIQDAKDGDVLFCKGNIKYSNEIKYERICLFNNLDNAFFTLTKTSNYEEYDVNVNIDYPDNTFPATKAQKEILFMVMKEAGYTFDFEKKELRKIAQKSAWNEEDDYNLQCMIAKVTSDIQKGNIGRNNELIEWLKSLKNKVQPQPKKEWSVEDENMINEILGSIPSYIQCNHDAIEHWLKSLSPQNTWKPSDEQMRVLDLAIRCGIYRGTTEENTLVSLFNDLKKLKE